MKKRIQKLKDIKRKEEDKARRAQKAKEEKAFLIQEYKINEKLPLEEIKKRQSSIGELTPYKIPTSKDGEKEFIIQDFNITPNPEHEIYFEKLEPDYFKNDGYHTEKVTVKLESDEYLSEKYFDTIFKDLDIQRTTFLNFGTGSGKSQLVYKYILEVYNHTEDILIICSPFVKLVEKDVAYIHEVLEIKQDDIFNYKTLSEDFFIEEYYKQQTKLSGLEKINKKSEMFRLFNLRRIQILTVDMFLSNPGDQALEQSSIKSHYLSSLHKFISDNKRKVHLIFDEIHEATNSFKSRFIYNLLKWKDLTSQVILSTATVTEPVKIITKHFAYLTEDRIRIIEGERRKYKHDLSNLNDIPSLEIHITRAPFSSTKKIDALDYLSYWLEKSQLFHILCYSRKLSETLKNKLEEDLKVNIKLVVSGKSSSFDEGQSSIGTAFKTGCNISRKADFVIILPPVFGNNKQSSDIFSQGIPSILQSIGRLRNNGRILIICSPVKHILENSEISFFRDLETIIDSISSNEVEVYNHGLRKDQVLKQYTDRVINKIKSIENSYNTDVEKSKVIRPKIQFPSAEEIILNEGEKYLRTKFMQFGKHLTPYVVWAAINDQFINCKLKYISTYQKVKQGRTNFIDLTNAESYCEYFYYYFNEFNLIKKIKSFNNHYERLIFVFSELSKEKIVHTKNGVQENFNLKSRDGLLILLNTINLLYSKYSRLSFKDYFFLKRKFITANTTKLQASYKLIDKLCDFIVNVALNNNGYFHTDLVVPILKEREYQFSKLKIALNIICEQDPLLELGDFPLASNRNEPDNDKFKVSLINTINKFFIYYTPNKKSLSPKKYNLLNNKRRNAHELSDLPYYLKQINVIDDIIHDFGQ